jgi:hypothetical protein
MSDRVPPPIANRVGHVGGIESIVVDDTRYYFGFDYRADITLSPLIDDPRAMAAFASRHMLQQTGAKPPAYWAKLVDESVEDSGLASDSDDREFTAADLSRIARRLEQARRTGRVSSGFELRTSLRYLLGASCAWALHATDKDAVAALERLGLDARLALADAAQRGADWVSGRARPPSGSSIADAAVVVQAFIDEVLRIAPANWGQVFAALKTASASRRAGTKRKPAKAKRKASKK